MSTSRTGVAARGVNTLHLSRKTHGAEVSTPCDRG